MSGNVIWDTVDLHTYSHPNRESISLNLTCVSGILSQILSRLTLTLDDRPPTRKPRTAFALEFEIDTATAAQFQVARNTKEFARPVYTDISGNLTRAYSNVD